MDIEIELKFIENGESKSYLFSSYGQLGAFISNCNFENIKILECITYED